MQFLAGPVRFELTMLFSTPVFKFFEGLPYVALRSNL